MTALVFPGQGSQFVGMAKDFFDEFAVARETFDQIEEFSKINIRDIIFENKSKLLDITQYTQLAIFCSSISIFNVLIKEIGREKLSINYSLGHSLGEYSALVSSKVLSIKDCSRLLKFRGEIMQNAYEKNMSGMAAIIGIDCKNLETIIVENKLNVEIANDNSPIQVVISGIIEDIKKAETTIMNNGGKKFVYLNVSAAFHSKIMKFAQIKMKAFLNEVKFSEPINPIISNYSAKNSSDIRILFNNLANQMSNKVRWVESIKCLKNLNETNIIEIGPGKVLSGLIRKISNNFTIKNINSVKDLENFINAL